MAARYPQAWAEDWDRVGLVVGEPANAARRVLLVVDCVPETVSEAIEAVRRMGAERAYLTHICHDLPHAATCAQLPHGVELAYDGLVLEIS